MFPIGIVITVIGVYMLTLTAPQSDRRPSYAALLDDDYSVPVKFTSLVFDQKYSDFEVTFHMRDYGLDFEAGKLSATANGNELLLNVYKVQKFHDYHGQTGEAELNGLIKPGQIIVSVFIYLF